MGLVGGAVGRVVFLALGDGRGRGRDALALCGALVLYWYAQHLAGFVQALEQLGALSAVCVGHPGSVDR